MQPPKSSSPKGLDLLLGGTALLLSIICIPMIVELSGGSGGRAALLGCMLVPPVLVLGLVQWRDAAPRQAREHIIQRRHR